MVCDNVNFDPSNLNLKCLIAEYAAKSSLSKAEYLDSGVVSFLEKKPNGAQFPAIFCCRTSPTCKSDSSTANDKGAFGAG